MVKFLSQLEPWMQNDTITAFVLRFKWAFAIGELIHFVGIVLLVGIIGLIDLRMLGVAKGVPLAQLHKLVGWAIAGFVMVLGSGIMFVGSMSSAVGYPRHPWFWMKMFFLLLAGINVLIFYRFVYPKVKELGPGENAPPAAKAVGAASLALWVGVIFCGRWLMF